MKHMMMNFKEVFQHKHEFTLSYSVGDFHKYYCKKKNCNGIKYTLETDPSAEVIDGKFVWIEATVTVLTRDEAEPYISKSEASLKATMWLMDNVEPTYSAGRDDVIDYDYQLENGEIVRKLK